VLSRTGSPPCARSTGRSPSYRPRRRLTAARVRGGGGGGGGDTPRPRALSPLAPLAHLDPRASCASRPFPLSFSRSVQRFSRGCPRRACRSDSTLQLSAQTACPRDSTPQLSAQPATRRPPRTVHRPRRPPQAHPDTALRRECRAGGWDNVVVVNYTPAPDPHLRTFADLATTRGRARATSGYRRATRGVWIPDHIPDDFVARCASLA